jgi:myo-inositol-1-phosphate synthase
MILLPGIGAVATTFMAGVMLARRGLAPPIGSLTQLGHVPDSGARVADYVPLATLDDLDFAGWDIFPDSALEAARHAQVLSNEHLALVTPELDAIRPMRAAFYPEYVSRLSGPHVKWTSSKAAMVERLREDIRTSMARTGASRAVAVWCGSTEVHQTLSPLHASVSAFEAGLRADAPEISNAQLYAWACVKEHVPFANGSPNVAVDFPAVWELARDNGVPLAGKDFKTGQTLVKTMLAPGLKSRVLGVRGWYSTNILGNRDGEVLDDPSTFKAKEASKLGVLESILDAHESPELYGDLVHKVRIDYYPPRGDAKEGWDNVDFTGWLDYPMQLKVNILCRDSILAAPLVLDTALFLDLAQRAGLFGIQDWLGFYFKAPMALPGEQQVHALHDQHRALFDELQRIRSASTAGVAPAAPAA